MLRLTTSTINGLQNEWTAAQDNQKADKGFDTLLDVIKLLQQNGAFGMDLGESETDQTVNIFSNGN